ncbi:MAG: Ig domain protein group 2 domain protein [Microbacterium sp.]|jgi:uncharacterized protein YjdB|nr:Ig domain protein group 2 domain protein [Microbacterium sp.]
MDDPTRRALIASADKRAAAFPPDVERAVTEGARRYRLHLYRLYAVWIAAMVVLVAGVVVTHPATGIVGTATVNSITLDPPDSTLLIQDSVVLIATIQRSDGTKADEDSLEWRSSDTTVATVEDGIVTGIAVGTATITADSEGKRGTATVTVVNLPEAALATITVNPPSVELTPGQGQAFVAIGTYEDQTELDLSQLAAWTTSNPEVASVDAHGQVRTIAPGTAQISASADGVVGSATVSVKSDSVDTVDLIRIRIEPEQLELRPGEPRHQFTVVGDYSDGTVRALSESVRWSSSDTKSVQIAIDEGTAQAISWNTTAIITAEVRGFITTATVVVPAPRLVSIEVTPGAQTLYQNGEVQMTATGMYEDEARLTLTDVQWRSLDPKIASVDQSGFVSAVGFGTVRIEANSDGLTGSATVTVEHQVE